MLRLVIYGEPAPQGSKRPFVTKTGKVNVVETSASLPSWRSDITDAVLRVMNSVENAEATFPLPAPLAARLAFTRSKPAAAPKRKRTFPVTKPDIDKLARAAFDPLTKVGAIVDDARIVSMHAGKFYPGESAAFPWPLVDGCPAEAGGICVDMRCGCFWQGLPMPGLVLEMQAPLTLEFVKRKGD